MRMGFRHGRVRSPRSANVTYKLSGFKQIPPPGVSVSGCPFGVVRGVFCLFWSCFDRSVNLRLWFVVGGTVCFGSVVVQGKGVSAASEVT